MAFSLRRGPSNANWACFACRRAVRRPGLYAGDVACPACGRPCRLLGTRIEIPANRDVRRWVALRESVGVSACVGARRAKVMRICRRHKLGRHLTALEALSAHPDRDRAISRLRRLLELA